MLFVSDLAAAVGRNQYQSPDTALVRLWRRADPASHRAAEQRTGIRLEDDRAVVETLGVDVSRAARAGSEARATALVGGLLREPLARATEPQLEALARRLEQEPTAEGRQEVLRKTATRTLAAPAAAVHAAEAHVLAARAAPPSKARLREFLERPKVADCAAAAASVASTVNKMRGTRNEGGGVARYEAKHDARVTGRNDHFYKADLGPRGRPCWVGGRVDGLTPDKVVEVKCRRNRFFRFLPDYEKVQIHAYMALTKRGACDVVQQFNDEIRTTTHAFDAGYWRAVCDEANKFMQVFHSVLGSEVAQDRLLDRVATE
jgi:hypothetical protein